MKNLLNILECEKSKFLTSVDFITVCNFYFNSNRGYKGHVYTHKDFIASCSIHFPFNHYASKIAKFQLI